MNAKGPIAPTPLGILQYASLSGARLFFGTFTGALRLVRGSPPEGWRTVRYGLHRDEILDVHVPAQGAPRRPPVVFFHGGGWMMGTKDFYAHDLLFLPEAGYPTFNVEYPKAPENPHPWILRSVLAALAFVRSAADGAEAVHVMGDSAGGNLAVMAGLLAANPALIAAVDPTFDAARLPRILSAVSLYGVMDRVSCMSSRVPGGETMLEAYGGRAALAPSVDAAHAITPMDLDFAAHPPCLLSCGEYDPILPSTQLYAAHLARKGLAVQVRIYAGATHGYLNFPDGPTKDQVQKDVVAFLNGVEAASTYRSVSSP
jgi:acetyl esterase